MEAIARHAGMTQGAIYSNFASKADLWWAIGDQTSRTLDLNEMFGADRPLGDELADVGRAIWQLLRAASRTQLLLAQEFDLYLMRHPRQRAKYARDVREDQRRLAALLERGAAERGETLPMDAEQLARTIEADCLWIAPHVHARPPFSRRGTLRGGLRLARRGEVNRLRGTRAAELGRSGNARRCHPSLSSRRRSSKPRCNNAAVTNGKPRGPSSPGMKRVMSRPSTMVSSRHDGQISSSISLRKSGPIPTWSMPATEATCSMWSTSRSMVCSDSSMKPAKKFTQITPPPAAIVLS